MHSELHAVTVYVTIVMKLAPSIVRYRPTDWVNPPVCGDKFDPSQSDFDDT